MATAQCCLNCKRKRAPRNVRRHCPDCNILNGTGTVDDTDRKSLRKRKEREFLSPLSTRKTRAHRRQARGNAHTPKQKSYPSSSTCNTTPTAAVIQTPHDLYEQLGIPDQMPAVVKAKKAKFRAHVPAGNDRKGKAARAMRPVLHAAVKTFLPDNATPSQLDAHILNSVQSNASGKPSVLSAGDRAKIERAKSLPRGEERRRLISDLAASHTRSDLDVHGLAISKRAFADANRRAAIHGPGVPVEEAPHGRVMDVEKVTIFLRQLFDPDNVSRCAFRTRLIKLLEPNREDGDSVLVDNIIRSQDGISIIRGYLENFADPYNGEGEQCHEHHQSLHRRCRKQKGHDGKHAYTPKNALSLTRTKNIIKQLTPNMIKELAGLDDLAKEKGHDNFVALKRIVENEFEFSEADTSDAIETIDQAQAYIKSQFKYDLKDQSINCDLCFRHSFRPPNSNDDGEWKCDHDEGAHTESVKQFDDMYALLDRLIAKAGEMVDALSDDATSDQKDKAYGLRVEIRESIVNFREYIAHEARGVIELRSRDQRIRNLSRNLEAAVTVIDWRMKLVDLLMREGQKDWFGKKGTPCIGAMVIRALPTDAPSHVLGKASAANGDVALSFYHGFTDDKKQDAFSVVAFLYKILHLLYAGGINEDDLDTDGAGCFRGFVFRYWMSRAGELTGVRIKSHHSLEPGKAKTDLDAEFGVAKHQGRRGLRNRAGRNGGQACAVDARGHAEALVWNGDMRDTTVIVYQPDRSLQPTVKEKAPPHLGKCSEMLPVYDDQGKFVSISVREQSGQGPAKEYTRAELDACWGEHVPSTPECSAFDIITHAGVRGGGGENNGGERTTRIRYKKGDQTKAAEAAKRENKKRDAASSVEEEEAKRAKHIEEVGYRWCTITHPSTGIRCSRVFKHKSYFDAHVALPANDKRHTYKRPPVQDQLAQLVADRQTMANILSASRSGGNQGIILIGMPVERVNNDAGNAGRANENRRGPGQYRKTDRAAEAAAEEAIARAEGTVVVKGNSPMYVYIMTQIFNEGRRMKSKMKTPSGALKYLKHMRVGNLPAPSPLIFSVRSRHGKLKKVQQVKSWFNLFSMKVKAGKAIRDPLKGFVHQMKKEAIKAALVAFQDSVEGAKKPELEARLLNREKASILAHFELNAFADIATDPYFLNIDN